MNTRNRIITALACIAAVYGIASAGSPRAFRSEGHRYHFGTAPSISCGSGATVEGTDELGFVTFSAATTSCTITFAQTWSAASLNAVARPGGGTYTTQVPICTANLSTSSAIGVSSISHTAVAFTFSSRSSGDKLYYHCDGWVE